MPAAVADRIETEIRVSKNHPPEAERSIDYSVLDTFDDGDKIVIHFRTSGVDIGKTLYAIELLCFMEEFGQLEIEPEDRAMLHTVAEQRSWSAKGFKNPVARITLREDFFKMYFMIATVAVIDHLSFIRRSVPLIDTTVFNGNGATVSYLFKRDGIGCIEALKWLNELSKLHAVKILSPRRVRRAIRRGNWIGFDRESRLILQFAKSEDPAGTKEIFKSEVIPRLYLLRRS